MKKNDKILQIINQLRPYLNSDGGDIEFVKVENNCVYIKLYGACANCFYQDYTIQDNILAAIKDEIPEIEKVINIEI